jgi:hypothetical protein
MTKEETAPVEDQTEDDATCKVDLPTDAPPDVPSSDLPPRPAPPPSSSSTGNGIANPGLFQMFARDRLIPGVDTCLVGPGCGGCTHSKCPNTRYVSREERESVFDPRMVLGWLLLSGFFGMIIAFIFWTLHATIADHVLFTLVFFFWVSVILIISLALFNGHLESKERWNRMDLRKAYVSRVVIVICVIVACVCIAVIISGVH